jgi:hypothetical protein
MDVEYNGVIFPVQPGVTSLRTALPPLASESARKGGKKKKKSLRERVSLAPSGIESIPEGDGDFHSALYDIETPDSECSSSDE